MKLRATILIVLCLAFTGLKAQRAHLVFSVDTTAPFQLFIDGLLESEGADTFHIVKNMPVGEHFVKVVFSASNFISFDQPVNVKKEGTYYYKVQPKDPENWRWFEIKEVDFDKEMGLPSAPKPVEPKKVEIQEPLVDSAKLPSPNSDTTVSNKPIVNDSNNIEEPKPDSSKGFCATPLDPRKHKEFVARIEALSFDDKKLSLAKDFASQHCFTAVQIMETMQLFDFEDTKLDFAQFAYPRCFDAENYLFVEDILEFETSKKTLRSSFEYRTE